MKALGLVLVVTLAGCAIYDSTYWRHPATGVIVECEASWNSAFALDVSTGLRDCCERLMQRAGLQRISHDEGKLWEKSR
jgi:hypothetical protein